MTSPKTHEEVIELLGAFALDAVDPDEASAVSEHIASCPRCAAEVAEYHQVAGLLANSGGDAPTHVWGHIAAQIDERTPPVQGAKPTMTVVPGGSPEPARSPQIETRTLSHRSSPRPWTRVRVLTAAVAAAVALVIGGLGVQVAHLDNRVGQLQAASQRQGLAQLAQAALDDPNAQHVTLTAAHSTGPGVAQIVILPSGEAYVINSALPRLSPNQTYQLWGRQGDELVSLGLLGNHPATAAFRVNPSAHVASFAVTAEHAGGVVSTTHVPVAVSGTVAS